ncbi:OmpA family protein [Spirosoma montaniterrae]|uniref:Flagellar motor protein MotB n=1 Tax=Spirosoma montaniterrae TaxID=1178516 RepID=A0A1P9WVU2_9BACT|nr:OmpA family protein [Spirosoma montaniterrae]AQG79448.1 flagellar motor protein MotB [Spirosoma montaniterrae]
MRFVFLILLISSTLPLHAQVTKTSKPVTVFVINAVDAKTSTDLPASFTISALSAKQKWVGQSQPGRPFSFTLTRTDTLNVIANAKGYYEAEEIMVVSCDTCPDYGYAIRLDKEDPKADSIFRNLEVNKVFRLDKVYFDQSSYVLRPESYPQLDKLAKTLRQMPNVVIEIAGHTDNVGDRRLNQALSENRAKVIRSYLTRHAITETRLRANGYGDSRPAAPNDSEENKRKNRRVEFVVLAM